MNSSGLTARVSRVRYTDVGARGLRGTQDYPARPFSYLVLQARTRDSRFPERLMWAMAYSYSSCRECVEVLDDDPSRIECLHLAVLGLQTTRTDSSTEVVDVSASRGGVQTLDCEGFFFRHT